MKAAVLLLACMVGSASAKDPVRLFAAGSLRQAMAELAAEFGEPGVEATFGASGLLRDRLSKGEPADVFASANMQHPASLAQEGKAAAPQRFARNRLCALVRPGLPVESATILDTMLDLSIKLGTSTPKADPSGDYAWQVFARAERIRRGSAAALERKALQLTGGPRSTPPPPGRSLYAMLVGGGAADVFLTYCTNAFEARAELRGLQVIELPPALSVGADYGITLMHGARPDARRFVEFVLSDRGQAILARRGFGRGQ